MEKTPKQDALEHIAARRDKPFLEERYIDSFKGRGVFTHKAIAPSAFVVEYRGKTFPDKDTRPEKKCGDTLKNFLFRFSWKGERWCVDASQEDKTLGRLVNDDHASPNCQMRKVNCDGKPHLCLFAVKDITPGEEITYHYGNSSCPWRSRDSYDGSSSSRADNHAKSTPRKETFEDSEAASRSEDTGSEEDDDDDGDPICDNESLANSNSKRDIRDKSLEDLDSSQDGIRHDASCSQQEDEAAFSSDESDKDYVPIKARRKPKECSYTSKNYCYACGKGYAKIARHLLTHADEEPEIAELVALPKSSKERRKLLDELRIRGNYEHNQEVFQKNCGMLKMKRRPKTKSTMKISDKAHIYCLFCKCLLRRDEAWRHVARCASKTAANSATDDKTRVLGEIAPIVWKMLLTMQPDETTKAVQSDYLLLQLAASLIQKYRHRYDYVRQRLREMGRLLMALHEKSIFSFEDAVKPKNFHKVVEAVKEMAGFDEKMQSYDKPGLALKLGHSLKKIGATVLAGVGGNERLMKDTKKFMKLCAKEWSELVSKTPADSKSGQKANSPSTIPFTRDVQIFHRYLERTAASAIESLEMDGNPQAYSAVCRVTLAQASVLNKCAPEVSKMTVETFQERDDTVRVLSKRFIKINVPNETGQNVTVLLTSDLVSAITLLVSKRRACGIHQDNPFLFAKPNSDSASIFHGGNCIGAFSSLCRARNPEHLRSVHLQKHIARIFQVLNLENDELHHLAKLLGHNIRADREYYRSPEAAVELAKIAKLILAMEKGSLERFKGNSLQQMEIEDELEPDVEQGNPGNSDTEVDNKASEPLPEQIDAEQQQAVTEKQSRQLTPKQDALEHIKASRDKPFLEQVFIDPFKGRGVFTHEAIKPSAFVVEYRGEITSQNDIRNKNCGDSLHNYVFDFWWNGTNWRIDASKDDGSLGRLVNDDDRSPNCKMKAVDYEGKPHLCLFAVKEITQGEEITYNYGDSSYAWRSTKSGEDLKTSQMDPSAAASSPEGERVEDLAEATSSDESCCDDEYVPDDEPSSDDSSTSNNNRKSPKFQKNSPDQDSSKRQRLAQQPAKALRIKDEANDNPDSFTSDDEPEGVTCTNKNYCYVCGKGLRKLSRHLFTHRNEVPEIAAAFGLPLHSKERIMILNELRNRGNFQHNEEVLRTHRGKLKVTRRPGKPPNLKSLALCLYCKAMRNRKDMWRHVQKCSAKRSSKYGTPAQRKILSLVDAAKSTDLKEVSSDVKKFLDKLKNDEVASVILKDPHIQQLAQCIYHMNDVKKTNATFTHRLRLMGRLLLKLRDKSVNSIEEAVKPQNFSKVVEASRELAGFNEETKTSDKPSVWLHLGNLLRKIATINFARALKEDADKEKMDEVETFMKLCEKEWASLRQSKTPNSTPTIPFIHDVQLLFQCLDQTVASGVESLTMYGCTPVYHALLRVTVAQVAVLNKNMVEVSKVTLKSFNERDKTEPQEDAAVCQSQLDQILSKHSVKFIVRNNKGKKVAVTLTPKLLDALTLLVSKRDACGVHEKNMFLFAKPTATWMSFYQGHVCLTMFVGRCGAKNKANLRSVYFRKHIARFFQILSLANEELDQLAKLLGRDIRTDREYYQTPEAAVDIAKISELLTAMESGSLERFEGKSLEEIEIADELEPDMEQDIPEKDESDVENENCDAEDDNDESGSSLQLGDLFSSKVPCSTIKISKSSRYSPSPFSGSLKKRGRGRPRKQEREKAASESKDVSTEKDDWPEETPESYDVNTPEKTLSRSDENATKMSFSDDDEDMNVDFDMDFDSFSTTEEPSKCSRYSPSPIAGSSPKKRGRGRPRKQERENSCSSSFLSGLSSSKGSLSTTKEPSNRSRFLSSPISDGTLKKRGRGRPRKQERENAASELKDVSAEKNDWSEDKPEKTLSHSGENATKMSFSDDDEDMNVDFDMDFDSFSTDEKPSKCPRYSPSPISGSPPKKRGRGRPRKQERENAASELKDVSAEKNDWPEDKPEKTLSHSDENATKMSFSDDDEDMNVDFDMDFDTDEDIRNEENVGDGDTNDSDVVDKTSSPEYHSTVADLEEVNHVEKDDPKKGAELNRWSRRSCATLATEKNKLLAAMASMKEVKILIPKLDIAKLLDPAHISRLSSESNSVKQPLKDRPVRDANIQSPTTFTNAVDKTKPSDAKTIQMTCSRCKKSMMKGQTAFQKKGFTDVFCSKNCLFEIFPINKAAAKACHYCQKTISQPQDLIMAAVDTKGTMKDFCSVTCLCSFKSNPESSRTPPSVCSMCSKSCTVTCEFTLYEVVHKFCSGSCFDDFRRNNTDICENCSTTCTRKPLMLKLEEETITICSGTCLDGFIENNETPCRCATCHLPQPCSDMVHDKSRENIVKLFCTRTCVTSYRLAMEYKLRGKESSAHKKKRKIQMKDKLTTEDSTVNRNVASPAAESNTPKIIIADSSVVCCLCGKELPKGQTLYQAKSSPEVYCSASCLSERHPNNKPGTKRCYNCLQEIMRPHNMILAPVDDSGTVRELCSNTCLTSVNSKRNTMRCRMCGRLAFCKVRQSLDGLMLRVCNDTCFINYHRVKNFPVYTCDICSSVFINKPLVLKREDGCKTICSEECLVKVKENIETPQLCPMCQTSHQMSDMVENRNDEGNLDFFCSNRCMMVHKAQTFTVSERNSPPLEEKDIKEVKPSLPNLGFIKEEPIDEEYKEYISFSISAEDIKDEPKVAKEDLKIGSVFSFTEQDTSAAPAETKMDLIASCSNCKNALVDGETVYQRKSHAEIFCSSPCLLKFYQMKQAKNTCHFCLQAITNPQDVLQAPAETEETMNDFCSKACLSSFNYKRIVSAKISIKPVASRSQCSVCSRYCISRHEIIHQEVVHKLCSDPCFLRFCNMNNLFVCANCGSHCDTPVVLKMKDGSKKLCGAECLAQFRKKTQTQQPCAMCCTARLMTDMVENENSENEVELFCTNSCVMASKIQAVSASGLPLDCDHCGKTTVPACHLAMSDASIRNFCTLTCAMTFKETQNVDTNPPAASDQPQCDLQKPPEKVLCAQCRRILKTAPTVVQKKGKMNFVCSLACSEEFKRVNNITGKCEYCKNERIIRDVKKVDNKDCYFCSDGCRMLYYHELKEKWGEYCHSCAYCLSISKTVVTAQYKGTEEEFCSEDCSANYKMLFCHVAKCDTCGHEGKLRQSLPILGEVKHFCDLKCLLHFCNKKVQMVNTVSSPSRPAGTVESSPVIANVISLAGALARQHRASVSSAQQVAVSDIQTKVVGHASVQTVPKELKNKSTLCTPLVHNKGVSCTTQTVDAGAQTDKSGPTVLPVPVPVFLPVPMNMYSQYTPKPVCLPIPLPVPVFLPVTAKSPEREDGQKDGEVTEEGQGQEIQTSKERTSNCSDDLHADHHAAFKDQEDSFSDAHKETPPHSQVCQSSEPQPELQTPAPAPAPDPLPVPPAPAPAPAPAPPPAPAPALEMREDPPAPPLLQQTVEKVHNKNKGRKRQQSSKAAKAASRKHRELKSRRGADAWRRWLQWRESQTDPDLVSSPSLTFNKDVHHCSAAELNNGLCCFVTEVKRPDGEPYSPDSLFYLCLGIQQHLLENGHTENIFSDPIFKRFSVRITKILKGFKPSATASGFIYSRVEEEFLWDCKQLGAYSPIVLLNTLLFFSCKYFGFTTVEQHRQLSFAHLRRRAKTNQNNGKTGFLRFYPPKSFNEAESDADGVPAKRRKRDKSKEDKLEMMENPENPLRCPVRLYEFYLSKCPESVRRRADLFYLRPDQSCVPSSTLWFSSNPLDDGKVEAMLVQILAIREVQKENARGVDRQTSDGTASVRDEEASE